MFSIIKNHRVVINISLIIVFGSLFFQSNAQDVITLQNGNEIQAKVIEVATSEIKYKLFANLEGPVYVLPKSQIFIIKYESGVKEVFPLDNQPAANPSPAPAPTYQQNPQSTTYTPKPVAPKPDINHRLAKRHYISINPLGLGLPYGNYASTDTSKGAYNSGFATFGYSGNIEFAYFIHQNIGIGAQFGITTNGVNDSQNQTALRNSGLNFTFKTGSWTSVTAAVGPVASIPLSGSSFDFKLLVGYLGTSSPNYNYSGNYNFYNFNYTQSSATAESFLIMPGVNYRLLLGGRVGMKFSLDFIIANTMEFNTDITVSSNIPGVPTGKGNYSFSVPVGTANLSAGIFIGLWK